MGIAEIMLPQIIECLLGRYLAHPWLFVRVPLEQEHVAHPRPVDDGVLSCYPTDVAYAPALVIEAHLLDKGLVLIPYVADVGVDVAVLLGSLGPGTAVAELDEVPIVCDQMGVLRTEEAP